MSDENDRMEIDVLIAQGDDGELYACLPLGEAMARATIQGLDGIIFKEIELDVEDVKEGVLQGSKLTLGEDL